MSDSNICRWGILSTAGIAQKNWDAIRNSGNATIVAVASRSEEKAQAFIDECQGQVAFPEAPRAIGSYEQLLASEDVDAVYIPLPTGLRKDWVIKAAQAGKHVMCEKPCAIHGDDLAEMIDACKAANVQFMDGVMFMHSQRLDSVREALEDGESVGDIRRIATQFSFCAPDEFREGNIRVHSGLEPAGCLGDLGWYTIRMTLWTMKYAMPKQVSGRLLAGHARDDSPDQVPTQFSGELFFENGVSASFYNSFETEHQQWVNISGSKGHLTINDFVLPYFGNELSFDVANAAFTQDTCNFTMEKHTRSIATREYSNNHPNAQETNLFRNFSALALSGQPDAHWPEIALKTQRVLDACLASARDGSKLIELS
ncbi:MAG: Gfo/Idh/MocA family oxidoreductase [Verrucomicrobiota bacterium]